MAPVHIRPSGPVISPLGCEHVNLLGRYAFSVPKEVHRGELRPLRDPADGGGEPG